MRAIGPLIANLCGETRAGWSWMLTLSREPTPAWLAFHGPRGWRGESSPSPVGEPRLELWPPGGAARPVIALPLAANQDPARHLHHLHQRAPDPSTGWLLMLGLLHALDEASRARPRVAIVGEAVTATGAPTLQPWTSALTLADLQSALLRAHC